MFGAGAGWALLLGWGSALHVSWRWAFVVLRPGHCWGGDSRGLRAFRVACRGRVLGVGWGGFVAGGAVAGGAGLPGVLGAVAARRRSVFGRVRRLPGGAPARGALGLAVGSGSGGAPRRGWGRPAGGPRAAWVGRVVRGAGLAAADAWALADDRSTWRALRPTAGYAQQ